MKQLKILILIMMISTLTLSIADNFISKDNDEKSDKEVVESVEKDNVDNTLKENNDTTNSDTTVNDNEKDLVNVENNDSSSSDEGSFIPAGGIVVLNNKIVNYPNEEDFGDKYQAAVDLYNIILKKSEESVSVAFKNDDERLDFRDNIDRNLIVAYDSVLISERNTNTKDENGYNIFSYHVFRYDYDETSILAYNACIDAGIYNGMSHKDAVIKINNWICNNMTYEVNNGGSYVGFTTGKGQCKTYALMFQSMCGACGIGSDYIIGKVYNGETWGSHAWNRVYLDGTGYYVDSTWNDSLGNIYLLSNTLWSNHSI